MTVTHWLKKVRGTDNAGTFITAFSIHHNRGSGNFIVQLSVHAIVQVGKTAGLNGPLKKKYFSFKCILNTMENNHMSLDYSIHLTILNYFHLFSFTFFHWPVRRFCKFDHAEILILLSHNIIII